MQIEVIEFARNAAGIADANSGEFDEQCRNKVIDFMPGQSVLRRSAVPSGVQEPSKHASPPVPWLYRRSS